jgi:hypothetical protein
MGMDVVRTDDAWSVGRPDGCTLAARNYHNKALSVRTLKTDVWTVELRVYDLPYGGHCLDGITHRPNGSSCLPITVS